MIMFWWPSFLVPALMELCGWLKRKLPWNYYHTIEGKLEEAQQQVADETLYHLLRQLGVAFAMIALMTMHTLRLFPTRTQLIAEFLIIMAEVVGVLLLALPIRRALTAAFAEEDNEGDAE